MKDGNEPKNPDGGHDPKNQTSEKKGAIKNAQRDGHSSTGGADTARGSEPETRGASSRRG